MQTLTGLHYTDSKAYKACFQNMYLDETSTIIQIVKFSQLWALLAKQADFFTERGLIQLQGKTTYLTCLGNVKSVEFQSNLIKTKQKQQ